MGKILNTAFAVTLAAGTMAACGGEKSVEQEAHIVGFARGTDNFVIEDHWVHYEDQASPPSGIVRDIHPDDKFDHCREVANDYFDLGFDDSECWNDFFCDSGEDTHCEAVYIKVYDYDRQEEVIVRNCPAPLVSRESKPKPEESVEDKSCANNKSPDQRLKSVSRFVVWVETSNPDYKADKPGSKPTIEGPVDISDIQWSTVDRNTSVKVTVANGRIIHSQVGN